MSKKALWMTATLLALTNASAAEDGADPFAAGNLSFVPGEYVVGLAPSLTIGEFAQRARALANGEEVVQRTFPRLNVVSIRLPDVETASQAFAMQRQISASPEVEFIEPNFIYRSMQVEGSAADAASVASERPWHLDRIGLPSGSAVGALQDVVVAVIDTGVMLTHTGLQGALWVNTGEVAGNDEDDDANGFVDDVHGFDFYNFDGDPSADKVPELIAGLFIDDTKRRYETHGTHVACTIVCQPDEATGVAGVAPGAKVMSLKFLGGPRGSGALDDALAAVEYALDNGADIINMSWGGGPFSEALRDILFEAHRSGVVSFAAAGNGGNDAIGDDNDAVPHFPSNYDVPALVSVAASDQSEDNPLTRFSNFGAVSVDVAAPGARIVSGVPLGDETVTAPQSGHEAQSGTSMATPIAAGIAAQIMARFPSFTHLEVADRVMTTVAEMDALQAKVARGGVVDFVEATTVPELPEEAEIALKSVPEERAKEIREAFERLGPDERVRLLSSRGPTLAMEGLFEPARKALEMNPADKVAQVSLFAPDQEYVVRWREGVSDAEKAAIVSELVGTPSSRIRQRSRRLNIDTVTIPGNASDIDQVVQSLSASDAVLSVEPNTTGYQIR